MTNKEFKKFIEESVRQVDRKGKISSLLDVKDDDIREFDVITSGIIVDALQSNFAYIKHDIMITSSNVTDIKLACDVEVSENIKLKVYIDPFQLFIDNTILIGNKEYRNKMSYFNMEGDVFDLI